MTTFWKPQPLDRPLEHAHSPRKYLGSGVYVLWARCDVCSWSGSFEHFELFECGPQQVTVCERCCADEGIAAGIADLGWERR